MSINVMTFSGNVGQDMEIRHTPSGKAIGQFNVAVKQGYGDNEKTSWVTCKMFNERAEKVAPYVLKGMLVAVTGALVVDEWESKEGNKMKKVCCLVNDLQLPQRNNLGKTDSQPQAPQAPQQDNFDDDIPF